MSPSRTTPITSGRRYAATERSRLPASALGSPGTMTSQISYANDLTDPVWTRYLHRVQSALTAMAICFELAARVRSDAATATVKTGLATQ